MTNALSYVADRGMGMDGWGRHDGGPWIGLLGLVLLGVVVGLVVWLFTRRRAAAPVAPVAAPVSPTANAEAILAERLARSEISPEDYRTLLAALRGSDTPT
jgi:putative membrane protein